MSAQQNKSSESLVYRTFSVDESYSKVFGISMYRIDVDAAFDKINESLVKNSLKSFADNGNLIHSIIGFPAIWKICSDKQKEAMLVKILIEAINFSSNPLNKKKDQNMFRDSLEIVATIAAFVPSYTVAKVCVREIDKMTSILNLIKERPVSVGSFVNTLYKLYFHTPENQEKIKQIILGFFTSALNDIDEIIQKYPNCKGMLDMSIKDMQNHAMKGYKDKILQDADILGIQKILSAKQLIGEAFYSSVVLGEANAAEFINVVFDNTMFGKLCCQFKTHEMNTVFKLLTPYLNEEKKNTLKTVTGLNEIEIPPLSSNQKEIEMLTSLSCMNFLDNTNTPTNLLDSIEQISSTIINAIQKINDICIEKSISITICPLSRPELFQVFQKAIVSIVGKTLDPNNYKTFLEKQEGGELNNPEFVKIKNLNAAIDILILKKTFDVLTLLESMSFIVVENKDRNLGYKANELAESVRSALLKMNFFYPKHGFENYFKQIVGLVKSYIVKN